MTHFYAHNKCGHSESQTGLLAGTSPWDSCFAVVAATLIFSRLFPPPGRDGGAAVRDAGDEGHVHGGRRLPAARAAAAAGAGRSWRQTRCLGGNVHFQYVPGWLREKRFATKQWAINHAFEHAAQCDARNVIDLFDVTFQTNGECF